MICFELLVIVKTSHAIMNVHTLQPHVECMIMTVTFLFIIYSYIITRQNVNYHCF